MQFEYSWVWYGHIICTDPDVCFPEGFTFDNIFYIYLCVFIVDEGKEDPNTTIRKPSSANQGNAFHWFADDDLIFNLCDFFGIRTNIAKKSYILVILQGGGSGPIVSGSAHISPCI